MRRQSDFCVSQSPSQTGDEMQRETPLSSEDIAFLTIGPDDPLALVATLIDRKQPRWLIGWRDICRSTDDRTVIASVFPKVGTGDKLLLMHCQRDPKYAGALLAMLEGVMHLALARRLA